MPHKPGQGAIFGIVSEDGVVKANSPVYLYDTRRDVTPGDMRLLTKQFTAADGGFEFAGLDPDYSGYLLTATDEDGAEPKNALVQDRVQPISAQMPAAGMAEWSIRAMKMGAVAGIVPWPVRETGPLRPFGLFGRPQTISVDSTAWVEPDEVMTFPAHTSMAGFRTHISGSIAGYGRATPEGATSVSVEFYLDFDTINLTSTDLVIVAVTDVLDQATRDAHVVGGVTGSDYGQFVIGLHMDPNTKILDVMDSGAYSGGPYFSHAPHTVIASFDLSALSGLNQIVITWDGAGNIICYTNGLQFGSDAGNPAPEWYYYQDATAYSECVIVVGGLANGSLQGAEAVYGPVAFYHRALSASEVANNHKALFDQSGLASVYTGYARELVGYYPIFYVPMDETDVSSGLMDGLAWRDPLTNKPTSRYILTTADDTSGVTYANGPIAGKTAAHKTSAVSYSATRFGPVGVPFQFELTATCWAYFEQATPASAETIFDVQQRYSSAYPNNRALVKLSRSTAGELIVNLGAGGVVETHNTGYTPPTTTWVNIWCVVDRTDQGAATGDLLVYAGDSATQPALVATIATSLNAIFSTQTIIGTTLPHNSTREVFVGENLEGSIAELAILAVAMTEAEIANVWTAKDTV